MKLVNCSKCNRMTDGEKPTCARCGSSTQGSNKKKRTNCPQKSNGAEGDNLHKILYAISWIFIIAGFYGLFTDRGWFAVIGCIVGPVAYFFYWLIAPDNSKGNTLRCPKCKSNDLLVDKQGCRIEKVGIGSALLGPFGAIIGLLVPRIIIIYCMECNHMWRPGYDKQS